MHHGMGVACTHRGCALKEKNPGTKTGTHILYKTTNKPIHPPLEREGKYFVTLKCKQASLRRDLSLPSRDVN